MPRDREETSSEVPSPCVRNCCLDEADVCLGCGRAIDEILVWRQSESDEREAILVRSRERLRLRGR